MNNIPGLKSFITNRRNSLSSQLTAYGCITGMDGSEPEKIESDSYRMEIYPNPCSGHVKFIPPLAGQSLKFKAGEMQLTVFDMYGNEVYSQTLNPVYSKAGMEHGTLNFDLPGGIYFLQVKSENKISTQKLIISR